MPAKKCKKFVCLFVLSNQKTAHPYQTKEQQHVPRMVAQGVIEVEQLDSVVSLIQLIKLN